MNPVKNRWTLLAVLAALTALRLHYAGAIPLSEDEAYYWQWSRHLAWGYYDQGPMVAWMIRLGTLWFGPTELGVRFTAVVMSLGMSLVLYDFCRRVFRDETAGLITVLAANATIFITAASFIQTYDTSQAFFWTLGLYGAGVALFERRAWAWYLAGAACSGAILSKYLAVLLPFFILVFMLTDRKARRELGLVHPWLAGVLALAGCAPNVYWNATHHWTSFLHTVGLADKPFNFTAFEFLGGQVGLATPVLFGLFSAALAAAWRMAKKGDSRLAYLLWCSLPVLGLFLAMSAKSRVQANWAGPGYMGALLAGGYVLTLKIRESGKWRRWLAWGLGTGYALSILALAHSAWLPLLGIPPDRDPTARLYGWPQLGAALQKELGSFPEGKKPFVFGLKYQTASLAAFYTPGKPETQGLFLPGDRLNCYVFWTDPCALKGRDGLAAVYGKPDAGRLFREVKWLGQVDLKGPSGRTFHRLNLVLGKEFKGVDARPQRFLPRGCNP